MKTRLRLFAEAALDDVLDELDPLMLPIVVGLLGVVAAAAIISAMLSGA